MIAVEALAAIWAGGKPTRSGQTTVSFGDFWFFNAAQRNMLPYQSGLPDSGKVANQEEGLLFILISYDTLTC